MQREILFSCIRINTYLLVLSSKRESDSVGTSSIGCGNALSKEVYAFVQENIISFYIGKQTLHCIYQ